VRYTYGRSRGSWSVEGVCDAPDQFGALADPGPVVLLSAAVDPRVIVESRVRRSCSEQQHESDQSVPQIPTS